MWVSIIQTNEVVLLFAINLNPEVFPPHIVSQPWQSPRNRFATGTMACFPAPATAKPVSSIVKTCPENRSRARSSKFYCICLLIKYYFFFEFKRSFQACRAQIVDVYLSLCLLYGDGYHSIYENVLFNSLMKIRCARGKYDYKNIMQD